MQQPAAAPRNIFALFRSPEFLGLFLALLATLGWSLNFIIGRGVAEAVPPITLCLFRWLVSFLLLAPFTLPVVIRNYRHFLMNRRYYLSVAFVGMALVNTLIYAAAHTVAALNLSLTAATSPLFVLILSRIFFGEPITYMRLAGIAAVLAGICLLTTRGDLAALAALDFHTGDLLMLGGSFCFAVFTLLMRLQPQGCGPFSSLTVIFALGILMLLPFSLWEVRHQTVDFTLPVIGSFLYIGLVASVFCFWVWGWAISLIGPARAAIVYYSLPLFCGIEAVLILGEAVLWVHFASGVLILGGLALATRPPKKLEG